MFVAVDGTPLQNGRTIGRACRAVLRKRVRQTRAMQSRQRIPDRLIAARVKDFARCVRRVARHWLDETAGLAEAAGVHVDDVLMLNCLPPNFYPPWPGDCTAFVRIGRTANMLLKIRDKDNQVQQFLILASPGRVAFHAGRDVGNLGVAHFLNRHVVAGANNTGSYTDHARDDPLLNDCHTLRYLAERAHCVDDVPRLVARLLDAKVLGGAGPGRGAILLLADPNHAVLAECHPTDVATRFIDRGVLAATNHFVTAEARAWQNGPPDRNTRTRLKRVTQLLARHGNDPSPLDVFAITRDRRSLPHALCNDDSVHRWMTVSGQLHVIDRTDPHRSVNFMCCGNPRNSLFVPVPVDARRSFLPLLDGRFYQRADRLYHSRGCGPHLRACQLAFERRAVNGLAYPDACRQAFDLLADPDG